MPLSFLTALLCVSAAVSAELKPTPSLPLRSKMRVISSGDGVHLTWRGWERGATGGLG